MEPGTSEWTAVMNRLERLEKQNRRMKQIGASALVLIGAVLLMGQATPTKTVEANEFILRDTSGIVRGRWSPQAFVILDAKGASGAMLNTTQGPALTLLDAKGKARAELALTARGPELTFQGVNGKRVASLFADGNAPMLSLYDGNGRARATLGVVLESPSLTLLDDTGKTRAALLVTPDGPTLTFSDENGKERVGMGIEGNVPKVVVQDADRKAVAQLSETSEGASFAIRDKEGRQGTWTGQKLVLLDVTGKNGVGIGSGPILDMGPNIGLLQNGLLRAILAMSARGPVLELLDENNKVLWQAP